MPLEPGITRAIESLILPPGGLILLFLLGLMLGRNLLGRSLILLGLAGLYLLSTPFLADRLAAGLEVHPALQPGDLQPPQAEAIVVLGAGRYSDAPEYGGDTVNALMLERLRYAARLQRRTGLPLVVSGGGGSSGEPAEAELGRTVLEEALGVPVAATEERSRTTRENALYTAELLERRGHGRVYLVTHAWHMPRAARAFERAGVAVVPAPTSFVRTGSESGGIDWRDWLPNARALRQSHLFLHEHLGALWYDMA